MGPAPQHKIRRKRLSEELTARLRKYIIDHDLKPGDPLLTEREMVERFGVSHTVVREATKALDFLGIIDAAPRRGMVLDKFDFDRVSDYFGFHFALSDYPREKLLKARVVIETGVLHYTMEAMRSNPELYPRLLELAKAAPDADHIDDRWIDYDIAFHRGLVDASDIAPLASFCDLLQAFFHRYRDEMVAQNDLRLGRDVHCQIVEALHAGNLGRATELLRSHVTWHEEHDR
jgi:GntR family transcriptional regulator, transcriptional repressor for pyruvate dehydrogenase complex